MSERRYRITYRTKGDPDNGVPPSRADFYSDADTTAGAWAQFDATDSNVDPNFISYLVVVDPDEWLDKGLT